MYQETLNVRLKQASYEGHLNVVKYLVSKGADIHAGDDESLRWASYEGHLNVVKYLVSKGANVEAWDDWALQWAKVNNHTYVVNYLESLTLKEKRLECLKKI